MLSNSSKQVGYFEDDKYYSGITCEYNAVEDERKFDEYLEEEIKIVEYYDKNILTYNSQEIYNITDEKKEYSDVEEFVAPSLHRKNNDTLIPWDELPTSDWDTESYLGSCSESEFAFDDTLEQEQQENPTPEIKQIDIAPEDMEEKWRPRPRGKHNNSKQIYTTHYDIEDDEQSYIDLLPNARKFGTI